MAIQALFTGNEFIGARVDLANGHPHICKFRTLLIGTIVHKVRYQFEGGGSL